MTYICTPSLAGSWTQSKCILEHDGKVYRGIDSARMAARVYDDLREADVKLGDRVLLVMDNQPAVIAAIVAVWSLGATLVPLPPPVSLLQRTGSSWPEMARRIKLTSPSVIVAYGIDEVAEGRGLHWIRLDSERSDPEEWERATNQIPDGLPAVIQFSSGSTGEAKPIYLTRSNIMTNVRALAKRLGLNADSVFYSWLPLHHDMGLMGGIVTSLTLSAKLVLSTPREFVLDPIGWLVGIAKSRATFIGGPPFAYRQVLRRLNEKSLKRITESGGLGSLTVALIGAERIPPRLAVSVEEELAPLGWRTGTLYPSYGLAENTVIVTGPSTSQPLSLATVSGERLVRTENLNDANFVGCGRAVDGTRVEIRTPDGEVCADGAVGEIWVGGLSYVDTDEGTLAPTGDIGAILDGDLFPVGRVKELVKIGGRAIPPQTIEELLENALKNVADIGVGASYNEDEATDEVFVLIEARGLSDADVERVRKMTQDVLVGNLGVRARAVRVVRPGMIPRTTSGKIARNMIADKVRGLSEGN